MKQLFFAVSILILHFISFGQTNFEVNYDEAKVPAYTLPEILRSKENVVIKTRSQWESTRRPEILKMFEVNIYGQMPKDYDSLAFVVINNDDNAMNGKSRLKEIAITVFRNNQSVLINLTVFLPKTNKPAPLFLLINKSQQTKHRSHAQNQKRILAGRNCNRQWICDSCISCRRPGT